MLFRKAIFVVSACGFAVGLAGTPAAAATSFQDWIADLKAEALGKGISARTLDTALSGLRPVPRVIELDRHQPEFTLTFEEYMTRVVPPSRVEKARRKLREHRDLLRRVARRFGVQPRFIVALWGIESDFGRLTGGFQVIPALATLAHDGRRSRFFRRELLDALRILDQGHVTLSRMRGSWAGAMGQVQFMPSSFLRFAVDYDGDGRKDLWSTPADIFASAANYLSRSGWRGNRTWGRPVRVPSTLDRMEIGLSKRRPLAEWQALGVRRQDGGDLPEVAIDASLITPVDGGDPTKTDRFFLVYDNYRTLLKWNRSHFFALAVGRLADLLIGH